LQFVVRTVFPAGVSGAFFHGFEGVALIRFAGGAQFGDNIGSDRTES
jgi:hypothetical protein